MTEADIYTGFTLRALPGGHRVAVFQLIAPDGMPPTEESVFDAPSLDIRVRNLRRHGLDASMSEAALRALRSDGTHPGRAPDAVPLAAVMPMAALPADPGIVADLPGRSDLLRAIEAAMASGGHVHGPCLVRLGLRSFPEIVAGRGPAAEMAVLLGVADRLAENVRRVDTLAYLGGATFGACMPRVPRPEAEAIAGRLGRSVAGAPIEAPGGPVAVALDVEVLEAPRSGTDGAARRAAQLLAALGPIEAIVGPAVTHVAAN